MKNLKYTFYTCLGLLILCKLFYWLNIFPNPDEAYYWLWGRRPALSYHDHPALQSLTQGLFYEMFGKSLFVLRLPVFIFSVIAAIVYYAILKKLNYHTNKHIVVLSIFCIPLIFLFTSFAWHDYMMISMCLCSGFFWMNYLSHKWDNQKGKTIDIFLGFTFLGLAALCKYNSVFVALGIASLIISNKPLRSVLSDVRVYLGVILCLLIISPIFIWNSQHGYGSFVFTLGKRTLIPFLNGNLFDGNFWGFVLGTVVLTTPFILWAIIKALWKKTDSPDAGNSYAIVYRKFAKHVFLWSSVSFLLLSTFSIVLYYWNIPAYLFVLPLAVVFLLEKRRKWLYITLGYSLFVNSIVIIHFGVLPLTSFIENAEDRDGVHHYGWKVIGDKLKTLQEKYPEKPQIFTSSYRTASLLSFQLDRKDIYSYSSRFDQFDYWTDKITYDSRYALVLVGDWKRMNNELRNVLKNLTVVDTVHIKKWGYPIKDYYIYSAEIKDAYVKKPDN